MFNRRVKVMLGMLAFGALVLAVRLVDLQVLQAGALRARAEKNMQRPARQVPTVRGRVLDRYGRVLADDRPRWELRVYYRVIDESLTEGYIARRGRIDAREARREGRSVDRDALAVTMRDDISRMWEVVREETQMTAGELAAARQAVIDRVALIRRLVSESRGMPTKVHEEKAFHSLVSGLDDQEALGLRAKLAGMRWAEVKVANSRVYGHAESMCHVLGGLGEVTRAVVYDDPNNEERDLLVRYEPGDLMGVSGVERLVEPRLRGRRGLVREDIHGTLLERVAPEPGEDVRLTIDVDLQEAVLDILADAVESNEQSRGGGGAAVVMDVATREVLALVSYPVFDANHRRRSLHEFEGNARARPLVFRAVAGTYAPGSVCKTVALAGGLTDGVVRPGDQVECTGRLFPGVNRWRCWTASRKPALPPHGWVNASDSLKHSCNIYFYKLGEAMGGDRLTQWQTRFGFGVRPGTGLIEERSGIVPTPEWLERYRDRSMRVGDARNLALGQGDLTVTPLQVANLAATIAAGAWRSPTVVVGDERDRVSRSPGGLGVSASTWGVIRDGMYRVVNERGGTAHRTVKIEGLAISGKSGSAQAGPRGTHSWFMAYGPSRSPKVAVAAMIEHGGGGGRVAGPVVRRIFEYLMGDERGYLKTGAVN